MKNTRNTIFGLAIAAILLTGYTVQAQPHHHHRGAFHHSGLYTVLDIVNTVASDCRRQSATRGCHATRSRNATDRSDAANGRHTACPRRCDATRASRYAACSRRCDSACSGCDAARCCDATRASRRDARPCRDRSGRRSGSRTGHRRPAPPGCRAALRSASLRPRPLWPPPLVIDPKSL